MFAIVCLQVAFPKIYELLQEESRFWDWNEESARGVTQGKEEEEKDFDKNFTTAKKDKNFDELWEQSLYRVCYLNKSNRARVSDISELLNYIKKEVVNSDLEELAKRGKHLKLMKNLEYTHYQMVTSVPLLELGNKHSYSKNNQKMSKPRRTFFLWINLIYLQAQRLHKLQSL